MGSLLIWIPIKTWFDRPSLASVVAVTLLLEGFLSWIPLGLLPPTGSSYSPVGFSFKCFSFSPPNQCGS